MLPLKRLNDQYVQSWRSKIENSSRFTLLKKLKTTFDRSVYIDRVRNPVVRLVTYGDVISSGDAISSCLQNAPCTMRLHCRRVQMRLTTIL